MAKSIFEILDDLNTTTSVPGFGSEVEHTIPRNLFPTAEQFEDEEKLIQWADEKGINHAILQKGIQKFLIEVRAAFKACKKDDEWSPEYGQKNVDAMEWKVTERPKQGTNVKALEKAKLDAGREMAQAMRNANLDDNMILSALKPVYGDDGANEIMNSLT